jgi:hypothetical protein
VALVAETVVDPSGRSWTVRRRWLPRLPGETLWGRFWKRSRRSSRAMRELAPDVADVGGFGDGIGGVVATIALILVGLLLFLFVLPALLALVEVLLLLLLGMLVLAARVVFRRPWTVEAARDDEVLTWQVVGWKASGAQVRRVSALLSDGVRPEGAEVRPNRSQRSPDDP